MAAQIEKSPSRSSAGLKSPLLPKRWLEGGWAFVDRGGLIVELNSALADWLEGPPEEFVGRPFWPLLHACFPESGELLANFREKSDRFGKIVAQNKGVSEGQAQWFQIESARHESAAFIRLSSILPPLAELEESFWDEHLRPQAARRQMFARLLRAEAQLENLMRRWPGVLFSQRPDFSFMFLSPKIEALTGLSAAEWQRHPNLFWELVHESDREELQKQLKGIEQSPHGVTTTFRLRHRQTGRFTYLLEHRQAVTSSNGLVLGYEGVWVDVTRQTLAEKRLSAAGWKETLAQLTIGLAHDFTNVLAGIHSLSESFLAQVDAGHPFREGLTLIRNNSLQASQLVHRIINLHRGKTGESEHVDIDTILSELSDLIRKIVPRRIHVSIECGAERAPVFLDPFEFQQVILNMVLNAVDAMPQVGKLILRTELFREPPAGASFQGAAPSFPAVCLVIQDTGCGIQPRHLPNIFDPFFTTKPVNKGSGLGLYNARTFLEKNRGAITVESAEGAGATFQIWLSASDLFDKRDASGASGAPLPKRLSLLLAGPPGDTLEGNAEFFRSQDYHVVTAISPDNAMELLQCPEYDFSGLLLMVEPNEPAFLSLAPRIRERWPALKIMAKPFGLRDDLNPRLLQALDLVVAPDWTESNLLEKIKTTLEFKAAPR